MSCQRAAEEASSAGARRRCWAFTQIWPGPRGQLWCRGACSLSVASLDPSLSPREEGSLVGRGGGRSPASVPEEGLRSRTLGADPTSGARLCL